MIHIGIHLAICDIFAGDIETVIDERGCIFRADQSASCRSIATRYRTGVVGRIDDRTGTVFCGRRSSCRRHAAHKTAGILARARDIGVFVEGTVEVIALFRRWQRCNRIAVFIDIDAARALLGRAACRRHREEVIIRARAIAADREEAVVLRQVLIVRRVLIIGFGHFCLAVGIRLGMVAGIFYFGILYGIRDRAQLAQYGIVVGIVDIGQRAARHLADKAAGAVLALDIAGIVARIDDIVRDGGVFDHFFCSSPVLILCCFRADIDIGDRLAEAWRVFQIAHQTAGIRAFAFDSAIIALKVGIRNGFTCCI